MTQTTDASPLEACLARGARRVRVSLRACGVERATAAGSPRVETRVPELEAASAAICPCIPSRLDSEPETADVQMTQPRPQPVGGVPAEERPSRAKAEIGPPNDRPPSAGRAAKAKGRGVVDMDIGLLRPFAVHLPPGSRPSRRDGGDGRLIGIGGGFTIQRRRPPLDAIAPINGAGPGESRWAAASGRELRRVQQTHRSRNQSLCSRR